MHRKKTSKIHRKLVPKLIKYTKNTGTTGKYQKNRLGEPTFGPEGGFGSIWGTLEGPENGRFERKMRDRKKVKKKVEKKRKKRGMGSGLGISPLALARV